MTREEFIKEHNIEPILVYVWAGDDRPNKPCKRYYLINKGYDGCVCVRHDNEKSYLEEKTFETFSWNHWEPIPEKTKSPITTQELIDRGALFVKYKDGCRATIRFINPDVSFISVNGITAVIKDLSSAGTLWSNAECKEWFSFEVDE